MNHYEELSLAGHPDDDEALLFGAMIRVWNRDRERVAKHGARFCECNPMFETVRPLFSRVPLKWQSWHPL